MACSQFAVRCWRWEHYSGRKGQCGAGFFIRDGGGDCFAARFLLGDTVVSEHPYGKASHVARTATGERGGGAGAGDSFEDDGARLGRLVGMRGLTMTPLRLAGSVELNGERIACVSEAGVIEAGVTVEVIRVAGMRVIVHGRRTDGRFGMRESDSPSPWKSLGCFGVRFFCALIVALILWGGWYAYAAHRLNAKLAEYRTRGEPASPQDFVGRPSLPSENAYAITFEAGASLKLSSDEADLVNVTTTLPLSPAQMETARKMLKDHAATLDLLHKARLAPYCVSPFDPINVSRNWENLSVFQTVAKYLRTAAFYHHQDGRDDLAIDDIHDIHAVAMATSAGHFLIHHFLAGAFESLASQALLQITPDLSVQNPATPHGAPQGPSASNGSGLP